MERGEKIGLGVATAAHVILFGLLSVGFLATPNPRALESDPMDVAFVDEVAWKSAAPKIATEPPAESVAPEIGPSTAPPPPEADATPAPEPEPTPSPAPPTPAPAPAPKPAERRPTPPRETPARETPARNETRPARTRLPRPTPPAEQSATSERPRGSRLGADFAKGLNSAASRSQSQTPRAAEVGASQVASLSAAIQRQVQPCANRIPNPGPGAEQIRTRIRLRMNRNGTLAGRPAIVGQTGVDGENGRYAQRVAELAISAFIQCSPYELPAELYAGGWEDIILNYRLPG